VKPSRGGARRPVVYGVALAVVVGCGLCCRAAWLGLSPFFAKYLGDALWALMIFLVLALFLNTGRTAVIASLAALFCLIVECSQLYQAPWLDALRATRLGQLALGAYFAWGDLLAYILGIAVGAAAESLCSPRLSL
jgi:glycopeptide antibiotics resistance protein